MMTATATPKTIRILESQLPEISKWRYLLSPPLRKNVVTIVPPPEALSNKVEVLLEPFIHDMKEHQTTYLILVRGNFFIQSLDFSSSIYVSFERYKQRHPCVPPSFESSE